MTKIFAAQLALTGFAVSSGWGVLEGTLWSDAVTSALVWAGVMLAMGYMIGTIACQVAEEHVLLELEAARRRHETEVQDASGEGD